jgi:hypothetical protein
VGASVSGAAQALAAFGGGASAAASNAVDSSASKTTSTLSTQTARMADAITRFSVDGQSASGAHADSEALRLKALQSSAGHGLLAAPRS